jgi:hypothetical protein
MLGDGDELQQLHEHPRVAERDESHVLRTNALCRADGLRPRARSIQLDELLHVGGLIGGR